MRLMAMMAGLLLLGLALAVPVAHPAQAATQEWKTVACSAAPISVVGMEGQELCRKGPLLSETRNTCLYSQFDAQGSDDNGGSYYIYLQRQDTGYCYMSEVNEAELRKVLPDMSPAGNRPTDLGDVHHLGDSIVIEFKRKTDQCFGFASHGGIGQLGHGWTRDVIGQFCTKKDGGYDDDAKRKLIASVKIAP